MLTSTRRRAGLFRTLGDTHGVNEEPREAERLAPAPPVPEPAGRARRLVRLAALDTRPLRRHRDFRLLFAGQGLSLLGSMVTFVAIPYQVYDLTGSTLLVGLLAAAELPPLLVVPFVGGAFADAFDRRRLVWLTELGFLLCSALLVVNALLPEPQIWALFVLGTAIAAIDGLQRPPLDALTPRLVPRDELLAASALESFRMNVATVAGPALGGLLIATVGLPLTYGFDVLTFVVSLVLLARMGAVPPPPEAERPSVRGIIAGVRYAASRQELLGTYGVDMVAMVFAMPQALFPAYAEKLGGPGVLGLLYAAPSAGALLATATSGWTARVHRHGLAVIVAAAAWGAGIAGFGLSPGLGLALVCLAFAGGADMVSGIFRSTIWNTTIPDRLRGRLAGIEQVSYASGPTLGNLRAGAAGSFLGLEAAVVSGGVLCIVGVAVAAAVLPRFRRYDARSWAAVT
jgi:MFS family permease